MSNIITYTSEEQKSLTNLANSERALKGLQFLLTEGGSFAGKYSAVLLESQNLIENFLRDVTRQQQEIQKAASERSKGSEGSSSETKAAGNA